MAIPVTKLQILRVMLQMQENLSGLQRDMRNNALTWQAMATAQSIPVETLAKYMDDAAAAYQGRLAWVASMQADSTNWTKISSMWGFLGGTATDFSNTITPLKAVANQLGPVDKSTYAAILSACTQVITAINAPLSLWPE